VKRLSFFLIIALFAGMSTAGVKYVAVVETDVDAQSGVSAQLNPAEVREITAELRRQATENLPTGKYSVMTSETVQSMGGSVLEECAEENCVVALGSRIGADYIVRGTVSKFQTKFTLAIELYETENGTLVLSSEAVRSENLEELLGMASKASANMFRKFAGAKESARKSKTDVGGGRDGDRVGGYYFAPKYQIPVGTPVSWGGVNLEGGWTFESGWFCGIDIGGGGETKGDYVFRAGDSTSNVFMGLGISLGNVYDLWDKLQFVYGGSVGLWFGIRGKEKEGPSLIAPFVKLRWDFVEIMYRAPYGYDGWNNHQLMTGFYFSTPKSGGNVYDLYFSPKYQTPLGTPISFGINLEEGLIWGDGAFFGMDFSGSGGGGKSLIGMGISLGNVYDLVDALQFVYGGSVGLWYVWDERYEYKGYENALYQEIDYLAPFVKLRYKYIELMYRGLLGYKAVTYGGKEDVSPFAWNNHQLMLGFYFATNKRER